MSDCNGNTRVSLDASMRLDRVNFTLLDVNSQCIALIEVPAVLRGIFVIMLNN